MKSFPKQTTKWILSTMLFAALGSQYYYSISSNQIYSVEMSSAALDAKAEKAVADKERVAEHVSQDRTPAPNAPIVEKKGKFLLITSAEEKKKPENQERIVQVACTEGCETRLIKGLPVAIEEFLAKLNSDVLDKKDTTENKDCSKLPTVSERNECVREELAAAKDEKDCSKLKTVAEKRKCLGESKETAKSEEKDCSKERNSADQRQCLKDEKARIAKEEKDARNDEFTDKVEAMSDKCEQKSEKLKCLTDGFASILKRYKKDKIDSSVVADAFNTHLEADLRSTFTGLQLQDEKIERIVKAQGFESDATLQMRNELEVQKNKVRNILGTLSKDIPAGYSTVTNKTIDTIESVLKSAAISSHNNYKTSEDLKAKNPIQALAAQNEFLVKAKALDMTYNMYKTDLTEKLQGSENSESNNYLTSKLITDMDRVISNLKNLTSFDKALVGATTADTSSLSQPSQSITNGRNARGGTATTTTTTNTGNAPIWNPSGARPTVRTGTALPN